MRASIYFSKVIGCAAIAAFLGTVTPSAFARPHRNMHQHATLPDSFLAYKVHGIDELIQVMQNNPKVAQRYAKHFHVPTYRLTEYMRHNFVESYFPETRMYTCYYVRPTGLIYPVTQRFRRGTRVFAQRNGDPVLTWGSGNPLAKFAQAVEIKRVVRRVKVYKTLPGTEKIVPIAPQETVISAEREIPVYKPAKPDLTAPSTK